MSILAYRNEEAAYCWQLVCPAEYSEKSLTLLAEISEFRGRTLYAGGRRPRFAGEDRYADDDPIDPHSFHVTVRAGGNIIGCVRVTHLGDLSESFLGRVIGPLPLHEVLQTMDATPAECVEAGRWIVAPSARGASLGRNLLVSMWVIGRWLGQRYLLGAVGVREGQVKMLARCGGVMAPAIAPIFVEEYDDEVSVMYFDLQHPPPGVAVHLETVERLLGLRGVADGVIAQAIPNFPMRAGMSI